MKFTIISNARTSPSDHPDIPDWYSFGTATEDGRRTWLSMTTNTPGVDPENLNIGDTVDLQVVRLDATLYRAIDPEHTGTDLVPGTFQQPRPKRPQISEILLEVGISRRQDRHINSQDGTLTIIGATARSAGMSDAQIAAMEPDGELIRSTGAALAMYALILSIQIPEHVHRNDSWEQFLVQKPLHQLGNTSHANALAELLTDREVLEWARRADDLLETAARTIRVHGQKYLVNPQQTLLQAAAKQTARHRQLYGHATDDSVTEIVRAALSASVTTPPPPAPPGGNNVHPPRPPSPTGHDRTGEDGDEPEDEPEDC